jgi:hypothetical protein
MATLNLIFLMVNGKGVSLFNLQELQRRESHLAGLVWKIPKGTSPPSGLAVRPDPASPVHFFLCPVSVMTMDKYRALLSDMLLHCERTRKI